MIQRALFGAHSATRLPGRTPMASTDRTDACMAASRPANDQRSAPSTRASASGNRRADARTASGMLANSSS